ncbi:hypothetical protein XELAEV_18017502mg [Xenopus laevis]|uniref:Uncharacterized protein n=1 Tax=Xenopus laevis TaxID=8355 RepID=A0A974DE39_XENLA|nr:hypothetical protein XELAEV_18017502mg [Xenopus laevis]
MCLFCLTLVPALIPVVLYMAARLSEMVTMHRSPAMPWLEIENVGYLGEGKGQKYPWGPPPPTHSIQLWDKYREKLHLSPQNSMFCSLLGNKQFPPQEDLNAFLPWVTCRASYTARGTTFTRPHRNQIQNSQFFRYLQIRHFISQTLLHSGTLLPAPTHFELLCNTSEQNTDLISLLYNSLAVDNTTLVQLYMTRWEGD